MTSAATSPVILNPGFRLDGLEDDGCATLPGKDAYKRPWELKGWTATGRVSVYGRDRADTPTGDCALELRAASNVRAAVNGVWQSLAVAPGREVTIRWQHAPDSDIDNEGVEPEDQSYRVEITGASVQPIVRYFAPPEKGWEPVSLSFVPMNSPAKLAFISETDSGSLGPMITRVTTAPLGTDDGPTCATADGGDPARRVVDGLSIEQQNRPAAVRPKDLMARICVAITTEKRADLSKNRFTAPQGFTFTGAAELSTYDHQGKLGTTAHLRCEPAAGGTTLRVPGHRDGGPLDVLAQHTTVLSLGIDVADALTVQYTDSTRPAVGKAAFSMNGRQRSIPLTAFLSKG
ncbi:hypothetical protein [Streptomyces sp. NPDC093707]|uniref:hypothetical protein n=1 Tax=Streptomyces sp. NPDC093707 TaxID=3154984 RepID=UPI00344F008F